MGSADGDLLGDEVVVAESEGVGDVVLVVELPLEDDAGVDDQAALSKRLRHRRLPSSINSRAVAPT